MSESPYPTHEQMNALSDSVQHAQERIQKIEAGLKENTEMTARLVDATDEMVDFFADMKSAFRVLNLIGKLAKPMAAIAALVAAVAGAWTALKAGVMPGPPQ